LTRAPEKIAEKSLEAFLTLHDRTFNRTHDIDEFGIACCEIDPGLSSLIEDADVLSDYAWKLRYPGTPYLPERGEADGMRALAERVFNEVRVRLPI
jgi:hypothetical protein